LADANRGEPHPCLCLRNARRVCCRPGSFRARGNDRVVAGKGRGRQAAAAGTAFVLRLKRRAAFRGRGRVTMPLAHVAAMANALTAALRLRAPTASGGKRGKHGKQQSDAKQGRAQAVKAGGDGGQPLASSEWREELQTSKYTVSRMDRRFERPCLSDYGRDTSSDKVCLNSILRRPKGQTGSSRILMRVRG